MVNKHTASILLTDWFLQYVRGFERDDAGNILAGASYKTTVIEDAYNVLAKIDYYDVKNKIMDYDGENKGFYNISKFLEIKPKNTRAKNELIELGTFYIHPLFQEGPKPRRVLIDYETMEQTRGEPEPFFLEIIESFTTEDLLTYYYVKHEMDPFPGGSHMTQIKNLTTGYSLDMILYMIEASRHALVEDSFYNQPATSPAFLPTFREEAYRLMDTRINTLKEGGLTHIVPREYYYTQSIPE